MAKRTLQVLAIFAALALVGLVGLTVTASSGGSGDGDDEGGLMRHLHDMAHHLHRGEHHHHHMAQLIEQLELTPEQLRHLEKVHEIVGAFGTEGHGSMAELHEQLVAEVEQGELDAYEIRSIVDGHLDQLRDMAYGVADEVVALVNGLDATQRQTLLAHLRETVGEGHHGH